LSTFLISLLFQILDRKIVDENKTNVFYESAFQDLVNSGNDLYIVDSSEYFCIEIDTVSDLKIAESLIKNNMSQQ